MELTTHWSRQATRAAGVTALAPAVLLGSAVLLAAGAGFGGLGSLGQVAGGPSLPAVEESQPAASASRARDDAATRVAALAAPQRSAGASGAAGGTTTAGGAGGAIEERRSITPESGPRTPAGTSPGTQTPVSGSPTPTSPSAPQTGSRPTPTAPSTPDQAAPVTPQLPQAPQLPSVPDPVTPLLDLPRNVGKTLPAPLGPLTDRLLAPVTGIAPR